MSLMSVRRWAGVLEEIERLADLRDKGVISDKDFQNLKKQLIQGDVLPGQSHLTTQRAEAERLFNDWDSVERFPSRQGGLRGSVRERPDPEFWQRLAEPTPVEPSYIKKSPPTLPRMMGSFRQPPSPISSRNRGYVEVYYCANCNKRVGKTAKFCKNCGLQL